MSYTRNLSATEVADHLNSAAIHLLRWVRIQDNTAPVGSGQLSALSVLVFGGPATIGQLADSEQVRSQTMTGVVAALESRGLVRREAHPQDRRSSVVHPTATGRTLLHDARGRRIEVLATRLATLTSRELQVLHDASGLMERVSRAA